MVGDTSPELGFVWMTLMRASLPSHDVLLLSVIDEHRITHELPSLNTMEGTNSRPIYIPIDQTEALASGLWGSVSRVKGQNLVMKIAKNANDGLFETEKRIFERLGESDLIARYYGVATAQMGKEEKSSLLFQYYPSGSLRDFLNNPTSLEVRKCRKQQLRYVHED